MALAETIFVDKCEVVSIATTYSPYRFSTVQVRTATVVTKDDEELARSFSRHSLQAGKVGIGSTLILTDISGQEPEVQAVCNAVWTTNDKEGLRAHLVGIRSEGNIMG